MYSNVGYYHNTTKAVDPTELKRVGRKIKLVKKDGFYSWYPLNADPVRYWLRLLFRMGQISLMKSSQNQHVPTDTSIDRTLYFVRQHVLHSLVSLVWTLLLNISPPFLVLFIPEK